MRHIAFVKDPDGYWVEIIKRRDEAMSTSTDPATYRLNHTMLRVKDAEASLKYYQEVLGMTLVRTIENKEAAFNLYFLGYPASNPQATEGANNPVAEWEGLLELTWNYGTEKQEGKVYHNGNDEPQGFGHICMLTTHLALNIGSNRYRCLRGRPERGLRAVRVSEGELEEASDGWPNEERRVPSRPRRILDRGYSERGSEAHQQLVIQAICAYMII